MTDEKKKEYVAILKNSIKIENKKGIQKFFDDKKILLNENNCIGGGGSGVIFLTTIDKKNICIKMTRKECNDKAIEHCKIIEEVYYLIKCSKSKRVLPIYYIDNKNELEIIDSENSYFKKIEDLKSSINKKQNDNENKSDEKNDNNKKDTNEEKIIDIHKVINEKKLDNIILTIKNDNKYYTGYMMEEGYPLDQLLGYYSYMFTNLNLPKDSGYPQKPPDWFELNFLIKHSEIIKDIEYLIENNELEKIINDMDIIKIINMLEDDKKVSFIKNPLYIINEDKEKYKDINIKDEKIKMECKKLRIINNIKNFIKNNNFPSNDFLDKLINDILLAIISMHEKNLLHLDIKEQNIMVIGDDKEYYKFVLFDFGSVKELDETFEKPNNKFESTYQYLPEIIQKIRPINRFTSHNRVKFTFKDLNDNFIHPTMIDLHALSQIIFNILTDQQFKRLSSFLSDVDYEKIYSFAQLISIDFAEKDSDSVYNYIPEQIDSTKNDIIKQYNLSEYYNNYNNIYYLDEKINNNKRRKILYKLLKYSFDNERLLLAKNAYNLLKKSEIIIIYAKDEFKKIKEKNISMHNNSSEDLEELFNFDFSEILNCELLKHLNKIYQLGIIHLNPPKYIIEEGKEDKEYAKHKRLDHSINTVFVVYIILIGLLKNSGWFRLRFKIEDGIFLLISALLHDIGHYGFAHDLEDLNIFYNEASISKAILINDIFIMDGHSLKKFYEENNINMFNNIKKENKSYETHVLKCLQVENLVELYKKLIETINLSFIKFNTGFNNKYENNEKESKYIFEKFRYINNNFSLDDFFIWFKKFTDAQKKHNIPCRLMFRILGSILSGPIDADKIQYLVNDVKNCKLSEISSLEGMDFYRFINNLRIPIRHLENTKMQALCLGVNEESVHYAQNIMFIRGAMFKHVYWSSNSRAISVVLRFIISESFYWFNENHKYLIPEYVEKFFKSNNTDENIKFNSKEILKKLAEISDSIKKVYENTRSKGESLKEMADDLLKEETELSAVKYHYVELCRIYPSDKVAYCNICQYVNSEDNIEYESKKMISVSSELLFIIQDIVQRKLNIPEGKIKYGSVLVDIPMKLNRRDPDKMKEFSKFAIVDAHGFGMPFGDFWDKLDSYYDESIRLIRVFIKPGIIRPDREEQQAVRKAIIEYFS